MGILADNKKALFNYEILERIEAGIKLEGWEVKSIRSGKASLKEGYVAVKNDQAYLVSAHIAKWKNSLIKDDRIEYRDRKLLLNKTEIIKIKKGSEVRGNSIVPLNLHTKGKHIKLEIALVRGKKVHDKRAVLKEKDMTRQINRDLKEMKY